jgi:hypothetical protein
MNQEANAVLEKAKSNLSSPDFKTMSIMESTKWCVERGYDKPADISSITGKKAGVISTALWKIRNPKRVKVLARRAAKKKAAAKKGSPAVMKTKKPKVKNGYYEDGMETPFLDALNRRGVFPEFVKPKSLELATEWLGETKTTTIHNELIAENRRLKVLVEHYESLLFGKGGK